MKTFASNEPVVTTGAVIGVIMAALTMLISLNVFSLTEEQLKAINDFLIQAMPLLFVLFGVVTGAVARQFVTPNSKL